MGERGMDLDPMPDELVVRQLGPTGQQRDALDHVFPYASLRGAERRSNLDQAVLCPTRLLRFARNDTQKEARRSRPLAPVAAGLREDDLDPAVLRLAHAVCGRHA